jgi:hypothetical protein
VLPLEGSAAIISVETCTGREFSVITVRVDCAGQSFQDDIFSNVTSSMISSHEDVFDMSNDDTCLYGGGVCDVEHGMPRQCLHFGGSSDIFSDAVSEGLIKDAFVVITEFNNVSGDVIDGERHLVDSIPVGLAWNKNKAGANLFSTHSKQMVLYICAFQTACKGDIIRNKKCVKMANGTDAWSEGTDKVSMGIDKRSKGIDKVSILLVRSPWVLIRFPWVLVRSPWVLIRFPWVLVRSPWVLIRDPRVLVRLPWVLQYFFQVKRFQMPILN